MLVMCRTNSHLWNWQQVVSNRNDFINLEIKSNPLLLCPFPQTGKKAKGVRFQGDFQDSLPRSRSYSGNSRRSSSAGSGSGSGRSGKSSRRHRRGSSENRASRHSHSHHHHQSSSSSSVAKESHSRHHHRPSTSEKNFNMVGEDSDSHSICSTCSSSSSSGDDRLYELPQRRHYGGVRVSYVPNDALAIARKQQQRGQPRSNLSSTGTGPSGAGTGAGAAGLDDNRDNKNCIISWGFLNFCLFLFCGCCTEKEEYGWTSSVEGKGDGLRGYNLSNTVSLEFISKRIFSESTDTLPLYQEWVWDGRNCVGGFTHLSIWTSVEEAILEAPKFERMEVKID